MKNAVILLLIGLFALGCSSKKKVAEEKKEPAVQYRDDFRSVSDAAKKKFLTEMKATGETASVLILTKGFKGEKVTVANENKLVYSGTPISNLSTGIAGYITIDNKLDTKIADELSKSEAVLDVKNTEKYKFIYVMKDPSRQGNPYVITYSNKLRPLK
ncbi:MULTISPECIES: hypothetical protein [Flavobacterium]|uniref:hypothetical protein n=1 Tax=Flavobacterium TaxID=237 RepID=UPI001FCC565F|nr:MULTISPECIES: hypothetical protein [Flavobacterium]UOK43485.1 hypothetical protein LZF87_05020 [Flavobacterium enshiense]